MLQVNKDERVSAQQALVSDYFNVIKENQSPVSTRSYETSKSLG